MSALDDIINRSNAKYLSNIRSLTSNLNETLSRMHNFFKYAETDDISYLIKESEKLNGEQSDQSTKENVEPNNSEKKSHRKKTETSQINTDPQTLVKIEKMSIISTETLNSETSFSSETSVKKNSLLKINSSKMPAPSKLPPKKKKIKVEPVETSTRSTRSKVKPKRFIEEPEEVYKGKPSDVIIQNTTITQIDLTEDKQSDNEKKGKHSSEKETSDDEQPKSNKPPVRSTRTKTRQLQKQIDAEQTKPNATVENTNEESKTKVKNNKRARSSSSNNIPADKEKAKRSKSASSNELDISVRTDYQDAVSEFETNAESNVNTTMVINSTMVVENPKLVKSKTYKETTKVPSENCITTPKAKTKKQQIKEIFSPYEKGSIKKKVEAFEKLGSAPEECSGISKIPLLKGDRGSSSAVKLKACTPFNSKFLPKSCSTSKVNKMIPDQHKTSLYNESGLSLKTLSAMKASQAEYRERERARKEKEREALLKKEALLQAQTEKRRQKREEKELKAQQQREYLQKEKEKLLEMQIEEKKKKDEKLQKVKEEAENKKLLAKNKAIAKEKKYRELVKQQEESCPLYMTTRLPLLPTDDCYDSDDERHRQGYKKPDWARESNMVKQLYAQTVIGEKIKNTLFCYINKSPDLVEIFENIDPSKLKRTSSAQWKKPPRYTLFSTTNDTHFSEDSENET